jgi:hypothetical protein
VGSTGGDDGTVGTDPEGGGEPDEICDGKAIAAALDVDDGLSDCVLVCLR